MSTDQLFTLDDVLKKNKKCAQRKLGPGGRIHDTCETRPDEPQMPNERVGEFQGIAAVMG